MEKLSVEMDVEKIRKESAIYRDLQPGSFLFEYRSKLNDAAFNIALENPTLISNKGTLLEQAKKKVEDDGYLYKKKKSRSPTLNAPQPEKSVKMNPSMRAKQLQGGVPCMLDIWGQGEFTIHFCPRDRGVHWLSHA